MDSLLIQLSKQNDSAERERQRETERDRERDIERDRVKNDNLHHYTKMLTMYLLKKTLTIVKIIHRLTAVTSIQKVRNRQ